MSNVVMCDAEQCGAFFGEHLEGASTGVEFDNETGRQRATHFCDVCTARRKTARSQQVFRPGAKTDYTMVEGAKAQD